MSTLRSLELATRLATTQRDDAATWLAQAQDQAQMAQGQLDQLTAYVQEKDARWARHSEAGHGPEFMHHHFQFMGRLQSAIDLQAGVIRQHEVVVQQARQALLACEHRLAVLERAANHIRQSQRLSAQRREQKQTDELAGRMHARAAADRAQGDMR